MFYNFPSNIDFFPCYCIPVGNRQMPPSKSLAHDTLSHVGEVAILQKLEEVGNSLKVNAYNTILELLVVYHY